MVPKLVFKRIKSPNFIVPWQLEMLVPLHFFRKASGANIRHSLVKILDN